MVAGKIIGGLIGLLSGGAIGAVIGVIIGHLFDRGLGQAMGFDYASQRQAIQRGFFETTFRLMGHLAKADGRVSEAEVRQTEVLMTRMGLSAEHRRQAIALFKEGAAADFQLEPQVSTFVTQFGRHLQMRVMLLEYLVTLALADGQIDAAERAVLLRVAGYLGIAEAQFRRILDMFTAQQHFGGAGGSGGYGGAEAAAPSRLAEAYRALGVSESASDADIKRAYRKLMSQHHPDKLIARGVPPDMVKVATEKSQEIQAAYEVVKNARR